MIGDNVRIYHAGDTNVFGDMGIIDQLYKPTHLLLPIGGHFTMGPREAALAVARYLKQAQVVIPMHFATLPLLKGTVEEFEKHLEIMSAEFSRDAIKVVDPHSFHASSIDLPF